VAETVAAVVVRAIVIIRLDRGGEYRKGAVFSRIDEVGGQFFAGAIPALSCNRYQLLCTALILRLRVAVEEGRKMPTPWHDRQGLSVSRPRIGRPFDACTAGTVRAIQFFRFAQSPPGG
jgi:hypothetical protein